MTEIQEQIRQHAEKLTLLVEESRAQQEQAGLKYQDCLLILGGSFSNIHVSPLVCGIGGTHEMIATLCTIMNHDEQIREMITLAADNYREGVEKVNSIMKES